MKKEIIKLSPEKFLLESGHVFISEEKTRWYINFKKIISLLKNKVKGLENFISLIKNKAKGLDDSL